MNSRPMLDDAPGLTWRLLKHGWQGRWRARQDLINRGYPVKVVKLWIGWRLETADADSIRNQCRELQDEMLLWARGGQSEKVMYDETIGALIANYREDEHSNYHTIRYQTRQQYDRFLKIIEGEHGGVSLKDIRARDIIAWHKVWEKRGVTMAHDLIGMVRALTTFGVLLLDCQQCERIKVLLHNMRFKAGRARTERLTAQQANAIRAKAHEMGLPSIALAQAFQFECMLRQKDVIGEYIPLSEDDPGLVYGNMKWLRGLQWQEIDAKLIMRHNTSKREKDLVVDLKNAPMVMEELNKIGPLPAGGPVVVNKNGVPWAAYEYRRQWRLVARAAGVSDNVFNMDSRAGAISEATDSGAELEHVRHAATHSDIGMTQRYSRNSADKIAKVQEMRVKHRNGTGTK